MYNAFTDKLKINLLIYIYGTFAVLYDCDETMGISNLIYFRVRGESLNNIKMRILSSVSLTMR